MSKSLITKQALAASLKELTKKTNFDKISIADITDNCGLNRQTFYYHFADKLELLYWIYDREAFAIAADISLENWNEKLLAMLKLIKKDKMFYINTIKCSNDYFEEYLLKILQVLFEKGIEEVNAAGHLKENDIKLLARFLAHGLCGIVIEWAISRAAQNEDEFSESLFRLADDLLETAYRKNLYNQQLNDS